MEKYGSPVTTVHRNIRTLRIGFAAIALLFAVFVGAFSWHSWRIEKEHEQLYLATVVEITGNSTSAYFDQYERAFADLEHDVAPLAGHTNSAPLREQLRQFHQTYPQFSRVSLSALDGTLIAADDRPGNTRMPTRADPSTFETAVHEIEMHGGLYIGRATQSIFDGEWVVPLRYGLHDTQGRLSYILTATLSVARQQETWRNLALPPDSALGLLRDDGFMISRYPTPKKMAYDELYGTPRTGQLVEYLQRNHFPASGVTEGYNSVAQTPYLFAFYRLEHQPLTVFVSTPIANVQHKWLQQSQFAFLLAALILFGGYAVFRISLRRQLAWEAERDATETRIEFLATHDPLTGLPNRLLANERLREAFAHAASRQTRAAVLFLDLDNFKAINDSLGHSVGDRVLCEVAGRLQGCLQEGETISRQGGDEFLVIVPELRDPIRITRLSEAIATTLANPCLIDEHELTTSASLGIAIYPDHGRDLDTLLKNADTAMYHAKAAGRNTYRFFADDMNEEADESLRMRSWLRQGLERGEFVLHYQAQIDLASGALVGAEALVRLQRGGELIAPGRFIAIAEDSGLIVPIGAWVLRTACRQAAAWHRAGHPELVVAVNLSAVQFLRGDLEESVMDALAAAELAPSALELELTESILIDGAEHVLETVRRLQAIGIRFSIDDFGTGYSSLAYLKRFNVDKLKIDQSFVRDMNSDSEDAAIVHALIQMAHSLSITIIAEGVEDEATHIALAAQHCDEGQGYFFSRPLPADNFLAYMAGTSDASPTPASAAVIPFQQPKKS